MRHGFANKKLNRTSEHRKALLKNMLNSLIKYEQIKTTLPKAKFLKPQADKIITLGKRDTLHNTKALVSQLQDIKSANKVKKTLSKRYEKRSGGYTRIIKAGFRYGDNAPMAIIEFVDRDVEAKKVDKKKADALKSTEKQKKEDKKKFETQFFYGEDEEKSILEKNTLKRIKKGRLKIESRLDLHGFTVEESKEKVVNFIVRNYESKKRLLLIITGKGKRLPVTEGWRGTGKLKENVPLWLKSIQLSKYILWFDSANRENGGEGALMIYLKKSKNEL